ncbi:hypothetical protein CNY89_18595, partial [Amaricoccus sp. HAR-UPW-R2A-40]
AQFFEHGGRTIGEGGDVEGFTDADFIEWRGHGCSLQNPWRASWIFTFRSIFPSFSKMRPDKFCAWRVILSLWGSRPILEAWWAGKAVRPLQVDDKSARSKL